MGAGSIKHSPSAAEIILPINYDNVFLHLNIKSPDYEVHSLCILYAIVPDGHGSAKERKGS
jgi:hypothetical protein